MVVDDRGVDITLFDTVCPECEYPFRMEDPEVGEVIICADCSLNLKVIAMDSAARKVTLELTETRGDDWGQ